MDRIGFILSDWQFIDMVNASRIGVSIFITIGLPLLTACVKKNWFTGSIEYQYTYESRMLNADSLKKNKPYKSEFRYDTINYQSRFFAIDTMTYFYSGHRGKSIVQMNADSNLVCEDYRVPTDSIFSFKVYQTNEKIMGHNCKIIEWQGKYFYNVFYVSTDLQIAPGTYRDHISYNWKFYGEQAGGGLILKSEHRFRNYTMKGIAVKIKEEAGDFNALQIDENSFDRICK